MSPGQISELSLSDAVAFRVDFDGASAALRAALLARAGALAIRRPTWTSATSAQTRLAARPVPADAVTYTVTLEPNKRPWLFALDLPAALPRLAATTRACARHPA